jgi:hypothetical protein
MAATFFAARMSNAFTFTSDGGGVRIRHNERCFYDLQEVVGQNSQGAEESFILKKGEMV